MLKNILAAIDFSETSMNAARAAAELCRQHSSKLYLVHIVERTRHDLLDDIRSPAGDDGSFRQKEHLLYKFAGALSSEYKIICGPYLEKGPAAVTAAKLAERLRCDLIVTGSPAAGNRIPGVIGSMPYRILECSSLPLLIIPPGNRPGAFKKALFPVLPLPGNIERYQFLARLTKPANAALYLLNLLEDRKPEHLKIYSRFMQLISREKSDREICFSPGAACTGTAEAKMLGAAKLLSADLLIITASTRRTLLEFIFGNYSQRMMHSSTIPIVFVKPPRVRERYVVHAACL